MLETFFQWVSFGQPPQQGIPIFLSIVGCIIIYLMFRMKKGPQ